MHMDLELPATVLWDIKENIVKVIYFWEWQKNLF